VLSKAKQGFMFCDEVKPFSKFTHAPPAPFRLRGSAPLQGGATAEPTEGPEEVAEVQFPEHNVGRPL